jgi:hypothetical protein
MRGEFIDGDLKCVGKKMPFDRPKGDIVAARRAQALISPAPESAAAVERIRIRESVVAADWNSSRVPSVELPAWTSNSKFEYACSASPVMQALAESKRSQPFQTIETSGAVPVATMASVMWLL